MFKVYATNIKEIYTLESETYDGLIFSLIEKVKSKYQNHNLEIEGKVYNSVTFKISNSDDPTIYRFVDYTLVYYVQIPELGIYVRLHDEPTPVHTTSQSSLAETAQVSFSMYNPFEQQEERLSDVQHFNTDSILETSLVAFFHKTYLRIKPYLKHLLGAKLEIPHTPYAIEDIDFIRNTQVDIFTVQLDGSERDSYNYTLFYRDKDGNLHQLLKVVTEFIYAPSINKQKL